MDDHQALPTIGPILLSAATSVHILSASVTTRRVVHMTALAVAEAAGRKQNGPAV